MIDTTTPALTAENLRALRHADSLVIRYRGEGSRYADDDATLPQAFLEACKDEDPRDGFGRRERRVTIPMVPAVFQNYATGKPAVTDASWVLLFPTVDHPIGTLIHYVLRAGDRIQPLFLLSNDSDNARNAGLTKDELHLYVHRGPVDDPRKAKRLRFMIDTNLCPPGSSARGLTFAQPASYRIAD